MKPKTLSRRKILAGATGIGAVNIMHWPASAAEFSWKYGTVLPLTHPMVARVAAAAPKIKEATNGRFEFAAYPSSALGGDTSMLAQCISGALQMYSLSGDILAPREPSAGIASVGFAWKGYGANWEAMDGDLGKYYSGLVEKQGMYAIPKAFDHGFRNITSRLKPINSPEDLKGFKIRLPVAPTLIALFKAMGASPTALNFGEVYSALQTGVVDGQENPLQLIDEAKFYEVQKYISMTGHSWAPLHTAFNLAAWKKLPSDLQDIIGQHLIEAATLEREDWQRITGDVRKSLETHGMIFNTPDIGPFRDAARKGGFFVEIKKRMGDQAWGLLEKYAGPLG